MNNYIPDTNPFKLAGPPTYFLRKLWEFDSSLVVVPSRQSFLYRLAQRRQPNLSSKIVNEALWRDSDTQMLASYNLVPVTTILSTANWSNPYLFEELRRRAPWRLGGAKAVNERLDQEEYQEDMNRRAETDENLGMLSKDAWNLYQKKIGTRSHMYSPKAKSSRPAQVSPMVGVPAKQTQPKVGSIFLP